ncbi:hypothetical protein MN0502_10860 [Arthrobacter sp. MN05-02]|nr:hypothetical protein MN0502_10860 [Arthrobacter sp. MN05-02]
MDTGAEVLWAGPRGRRLCLQLVIELDPFVRSAVFWLAYYLDPGKGTSRVLLSATSGADAETPPPRPALTNLIAALTSLEVTQVGSEAIDRALAEAVDTSRPWQEPDGEDVLAALPEVTAALAPLARHVMTSPSTQWWSQGRQLEQWAIDWRSPDDPAPLRGEPSQALAAWARGARAEEVHAGKERPRDPHAPWSGTWWSFPQGTLHTVGRMPLGLNLIEDSFGWEQATVIPVRGTGRTYEIRTGEDWVSLCREHSLEVTASRRHDWFRCTGHDGRWVIPDWEKGRGTMGRGAPDNPGVPHERQPCAACRRQHVHCHCRVEPRHDYLADRCRTRVGRPTPALATHHQSTDLDKNPQLVWPDASKPVPQEDPQRNDSLKIVPQ